MNTTFRINKESSLYYDKSSFYAYLHTLTPLFVLVCLLAIAKSIESVIGSVLIIISIGLVQYQIYFPLHDCSHYSLFKSRAENIFFGNILAGFLFTTFDGFKNEHMEHHKFYGTLKDPGAIDYWVKFNSRYEMIFFLLTPLWGGTILKKVNNLYKFKSSSKRKSKKTWYNFFILILLQTLIAIFLSNNFMSPMRYILFYILPATTLFLFLSRLRMLLEHGSLNYSQFDYLTLPRITARTIPSNFIENKFLFNMNFNYHYEHHRFPQIPSCELKRFHEEIGHSLIEEVDFQKTYFKSFTNLWNNLEK